MNDPTYIVTKDTDELARVDNICVTDDPDVAKQACDSEYEDRQPTFIEIWYPDRDEPLVTREHPASVPGPTENETNE